MEIFGSVTQHIFDVEFMVVEWRKAFGLMPSVRGWNSYVSTWDEAGIAEETATIFLDVLKDGVERTHDHLSIEVIEGPVRKLANGLTYQERMLVGLARGEQRMFGKVEIVTGPMDVVMDWDDAERQAWFGKS